MALANEGAVPSAQDGESRLPRGICALTNLEVGAIPMLRRHREMNLLALLCIFSRLHNIKYVDEGWRWVADTMKLPKQIDSFVDIQVGNTREA